MFPLIIPALISGASALAGAFANRGQTQKTSANQTTNTDQTTRPVYDEKLGITRDLLLNALLGRMEGAPNFGELLTRQGVANVNNTFNNTARTLSNNAISRGLGRTSAGFAPQVQTELARAGNVADVLNQAPLQQEQLERERLDQILRFVATLPVGQQQTGILPCWTNRTTSHRQRCCN